MGWDPEVVPDPQDPETFLRSRLDWSEVGEGRHARTLEVYRELAAIRRRYLELTDPRFGSLHVDVDEKARWLTLGRGRVTVAINVGEAAARVALPEVAETPPASESTRSGRGHRGGSRCLLAAGDAERLSSAAAGCPGGRPPERLRGVLEPEHSDRDRGVLRRGHDPHSLVVDEQERPQDGPLVAGRGEVTGEDPVGLAEEGAPGTFEGEGERAHVLVRHGFGEGGDDPLGLLSSGCTGSPSTG